MIEVTKEKKVETKASEISYPVGRKARESRMVVLFTSEQIGMVCSMGSGWLPIGSVRDDFTSCTDENTWEPVDVHIYG